MTILDSVVLTHNKSSELMRVVANYYSQSHRKYHGWDHIVEGAGLIERLSQTEPEFKLVPAQELAWLFHDIVYVPMSEYSLNERLSVHLLRTLDRTMSLSGRNNLFDRDDITEAIAIILDTIDHYVENSELSGPILDIDLSGFRDPELFARNTELIYLEFGLPRVEFEIGQAEFLSRFLTRDFIYHTNYARRNWEQRARDNISAFISRMVTKHYDKLEHLRAI